MIKKMMNLTQRLATLKQTAVLMFFLTIFSVTQVQAQVVRTIIDEPTLNGHAGYAVAIDVSGDLDKVLMVVSGFDTENEDRPEDQLDDLDADVQAKMDEMHADGWDIAFFEYVDGGINLKQNAENLAHFIVYMDSISDDYHLALVGGSMGGIVIRTMFVQENSNMGTSTYVTIDSPHYGVEFSNWIEALTTQEILEELMGNSVAGMQMYNGHDYYTDHYGWMQAAENSNGFMENIIDPMSTCAIALSNGEAPWKVSWSDVSTHNKFFAVSSLITKDNYTSTYMHYHSTIYMDNISTNKKISWGYNKYYYSNTASFYFDEVIPNDRALHGAPGYTILQAMNFAINAHASSL